MHYKNLKRILLISLVVPLLSVVRMSESIATNTVVQNERGETSTMPWPKTGNPNILVAGGAGYIGSHTILCLLESGYDVTVVDNLVNSNEEGLKRVQELVGTSPGSNRVRFYKVDLCDKKAVERVFRESPRFAACIHFAGLKAVGESVREPLLYYQNNLESTTVLLEYLHAYGCRSIVFSSSATVYGAAPVPITEETQTGIGITNPYGRTKYMIEEILQDFKRAKDLALPKLVPSTGDDFTPWSVVVLRYFNPVGNHPSGRIGEDPNGIPNNLMPFVAQVAVGRRAKLTVFGNDYDTPDGTGVRDYIHVVDLAEGHAAALRYVQPGKSAGESAAALAPGRGHGSYSVFNLGTGHGYSVLDMVEAMKRASGKPLPYEFGPRREGDVAVCYADTTKASSLLGWRATHTLDDMCRDLWKWQSNNPNGYKDPEKFSKSEGEL